MPHSGSVGTFTAMAALALSIMGAQAFDETRYPNWKGQWVRLGDGQNASWDPTKPPGVGQQAPLTAEYQALFAASIKSAAEGGPGVDPTARCVPPSMPRTMMAIDPMEIVITPIVTYFMFGQLGMLRHVYTDGRKLPDDLEPSFAGNSIGSWQDTGGNGRLDTLLIETRGIKGPHTYDASGIPFHKDGEAVVSEKLYADKGNANILHDEISVTDHALTRPWMVTRSYRRNLQQTASDWPEVVCSGDPSRVQIGDQGYKLSADGLLMPATKGQQPPNLKYFK
jgi:hypothetical protein